MNKETVEQLARSAALEAIEEFEKSQKKNRRVKVFQNAKKFMGYNGPLVCHITPEFIMELELELAGKIMAVTFSKGGIDTQVPSVDGVPLFPH